MRAKRARARGIPPRGRRAPARGRGGSALWRERPGGRLRTRTPWRAKRGAPGSQYRLGRGWRQRNERRISVATVCWGAGRVRGRGGGRRGFAPRWSGCFGFARQFRPGGGEAVEVFDGAAVLAVGLGLVAEENGPGGSGFCLLVETDGKGLVVLLVERGCAVRNSVGGIDAGVERAG